MSGHDELAEVIASHLDGIHGFIAWTNNAPIELAAALEPYIAKQRRTAKREGLEEGDTCCCGVCGL